MLGPEMVSTAEAEVASEWDAPPRRPSPPDAAPTLSVEGFEGPLDWLLDQVRARRIDLARLPILALVDSFLEAFEAVPVAARSDALGLARRGAWLVMAADLVLLRSRLLLPANLAEARSAQEQAETLRRQAIGRAEMAAAADWLDRRDQLGRDVFARGQSDSDTAQRGGRVGDITGLLRACLAALQLPADVDARYRPPVKPAWSAADAIARIRELLPGFGEDGAELAVFLPVVPAPMPDAVLLRRSAVATTFGAALELAREGTVGLRQDEPFAALFLASPTAVPAATGPDNSL